MDTRSHGWLVLICSAAFFVVDAMVVLGISAARPLLFWGNSLSLICVVVGLHFLWRTGIYQSSPLSKFANFAFAMVILSQLLRIMHWPFADLGIVLSFAIHLVIYLIHFYLKGRRKTGDILRLLVMVIACVMLPASALHWISPVQAYWAVIGMISLAILEYLLNLPKTESSFSEFTSGSTSSKSHSPEPDKSEKDLKQNYPELFDEE